MRRVALIALLGLASGLPLHLSGATLTAWLNRRGIQPGVLGALALAGLPYSIKFLWAPLVDGMRWHLPLSRRRGWLLAGCAATALATAALAATGTAGSILWIGAAAALLAFSSATFDVAVDAYRTDVLPPALRPSGAAAYVAGYRVGMLAASAGALLLADRIPWRSVYLALAAATLLVGVPAIVAAPDEPGQPAPARPWSLEAIAEPVRELLSLPRAASVLGFVALFRVGDGALLQLLNPFLLARGYSQSAVGAVGNGVGLGATIAGTILGAWLLAGRITVERALLWFGAGQALTNLGYLALAFRAPSLPLLSVVVSGDQLLGGLATAAFVPFLQGLTRARFSATQLALLTSLAGVGGRLFAASGGFLAERSWPAFLIASTAVAAPALWLARRLGEARADGSTAAGTP